MRLIRRSPPLFCLQVLSHAGNQRVEVVFTLLNRFAAAFAVDKIFLEILMPKFIELIQQLCRYGVKFAVAYEVDHLVKRQSQQRLRPTQQEEAFFGLVAGKNYRLQVALKFCRKLVKRAFRLAFLLQVAAGFGCELLMNIIALVQIKFVDGVTILLQGNKRALGRVNQLALERELDKRQKSLFNRETFLLPIVTPRVENFLVDVLELVGSNAWLHGMT